LVNDTCPSRLCTPYPNISHPLCSPVVSKSNAASGRDMVVVAQ
jgi:hypothetical protein